MQRLEGAYSTVVMTKHAVVAFRDPHGVRPLALGKLDNDSYVVASESCAFDIIGAKMLREVAPGELVSLNAKGLEVRQAVKPKSKAFCVFEHIYFSRPDTRLEGRVVQDVRGRMGEILWRESPVDADLVISVPDSGNPAAAGFSRASGIPKDDGLIKNRYVARTFIQPGQELRKHGLRMKFNPLPEIVEGQRVVVVDDSIVRGNTTRQIVGMLSEAGAEEVHLRISAPPIRNPCHYGVDMSTREEMVAHERTVDEIAEHLGRRLARLPLAGGRLRGGRYAGDDHCDACFTGRYPLGDPGRGGRQVRPRADREALTQTEAAVRGKTTGGGPILTSVDRRGPRPVLRAAAELVPATDSALGCGRGARVVRVVDGMRHQSRLLWSDRTARRLRRRFWRDCFQTDAAAASSPPPTLSPGPSGSGVDGVPCDPAVLRDAFERVHAMVESEIASGLSRRTSTL